MACNFLILASIHALHSQGRTLGKPLLGITTLQPWCHHPSSDCGNAHFSIMLSLFEDQNTAGQLYGLFMQLCKDLSKQMDMLIYNARPMSFHLRLTHTECNPDHCLNRSRSRRCDQHVETSSAATFLYVFVFFHSFAHCCACVRLVLCVGPSLLTRIAKKQATATTHTKPLEIGQRRSLPRANIHLLLEKSVCCFLKTDSVNIQLGMDLLCLLL